MPLLRVLVIASLCLLVSGCGFSLRSNDILSTRFTALQLALEQPNSDLARMLQRSLDIAAVTITESNSTAPQNELPVLHVGAEQLVTRPVTVNPRARAAQYELRIAVDVSLALGAEMLMGPETLLVERSYYEDIENIAGNQEELEIITTEMRRDLVNQLIRRLEAINI